MEEPGNTLKMLIAFYVLWIGAGVFAASLLYLYFIDAGVGYSDLIASFFFSALSAILVILFLSNRSKTDLRKYMSSGIFLMGVSYLLLSMLPPARELLFLYSAVLGANFFLFWVPFNILYFELSQERAAFLGSVYFSMGALLGIFLPLLSGYVAENYGFSVLFLAASLVYFVLAAMVSLLKKREYFFSLSSGLKETKGFKTLVFIEGIYGGGTMAALAVIPLFYFREPVDLGIFISVTTVFSVIASFIISSISDKVKQRKLYIRVLGLGLGLTTMFSYFAKTAATWYTAVSSRNFFATLFNPFTTAIIIDSRKNINVMMVGREFLLNCGRVFGIAIVFCSSYFISDIHFSLLVLGFIIIFYPFVVEFKRKYITVS